MSSERDEHPPDKGNRESVSDTVFPPENCLCSLFPAQIGQAHFSALQSMVFWAELVQAQYFLQSPDALCFWLTLSEGREIVKWFGLKGFLYWAASFMCNKNKQI
jgi:hypothetical protein